MTWQEKAKRATDKAKDKEAALLSAAEDLEDEMQDELEDLLEDAQEQLLEEQEVYHAQAERLTKKCHRYEGDIEVLRNEIVLKEDENLRLKETAENELQTLENDLEAVIASREEAWAQIEKTREEAKQAMRKATAMAGKRENEHLDEVYQLTLEKEALEKAVKDGAERQGKLQRDLEQALEEHAERQVDGEEARFSLVQELEELKEKYRAGEENWNRRKQDMTRGSREEVSRWSKEVDSLRTELDACRAEAERRVSETVREATEATRAATMRVEDHADLVEKIREEAAEMVENAEERATGYKTDMEVELEKTMKRFKLSPHGPGGDSVPELDPMMLRAREHSEAELQRALAEQEVANRSRESEMVERHHQEAIRISPNSVHNP